MSVEHIQIICPRCHGKFSRSLRSLKQPMKCPHCGNTRGEQINTRSITLAELRELKRGKK